MDNDRYSFYLKKNETNYRMAIEEYNNVIEDPTHHFLPVGYWPFHIFKSGKIANPKNSFMQLSCVNNYSTVYLNVWSGACFPRGDPTHVIVLMENGEKKFDIGRNPMKSSKDQVRILPRTVGSGESVFCFAVGTEDVNAFANMIKDFCELVVRKEQRFVGATVKPLKNV
eukprot:TRINITY_DN2224_c0_g1_i1.p1 TRINITY_DN2224_c0_g1~~TRINITY_DN2224_c0_g1_i1.p1  ORF type:complete len:176 (+),score=19.90 TRINITY_DN2224_c0_g1_i1:23-529(+)